MQLSDAKQLAEQLMAHMRPHTERIEIAGSIRRQKAEVKDIEIIAIPYWEEVASADLFGSPERVNRLYQWATATGGPAGIQWIKTGTNDIIPWHVKERGKYWRAYSPEHDIKLDLFLASPANWGAIQLIRTGSGDFSQAVMVHAQRRGMRFDGGYLIGTDGQRIVTTTEEIVFKELGLHYVRPENRTGAEALQVIRRFQPQQEGMVAA